MKVGVVVDFGVCFQLGLFFGSTVNKLDWSQN